MDYSQFLLPFSPSRELADRGKVQKFFARKFSSDLGKVSKAYFEGALHSSEYIERFVEESLMELTGRANLTFADLLLPTYIVATDVQGRTAKVWSSFRTPEESVAQAVRASCSLPFFYPPVSERYIDGGLLANLPTFVFFENGEPATTRVLAFSLTSSKKIENSNFSPRDYIKSIVNTVVDGAGYIQKRLFAVSTISIDTGDILATDFAKINPKINDDLAKSGRSAAHEFFKTEHLQLTEGNRAGLLSGMDEVRSVITERLNENISRVDILEENTDFVYKLFPSILYWRIHGIAVSCRYPSSGADARGEDYRRALLPLLGVEVREIEQRPMFRGYFFNGSDDENASALIGPIEKVVDEQDAATYYSGLPSLTAVKALFNLVDFSNNRDAFIPSVSPADQRDLLQKLATVRQYAGLNLSLETVNIADLKSITPIVHEFKYRQIPKLLEIYDKFNIPPFDPAQVNLLGDKTSLITPPVVELCGDLWF